MSKAKLCILLIAILSAVLIYAGNRYFNQEEPTTTIVAKRGIPTLIAKGLDLDEGKLRLLRVQVMPLDPNTVTNWACITNVILVWAESEYARNSARYFWLFRGYNG